MSELKDLHVSRIGQDSEFFLWDAEKAEVIPSFKYFSNKKTSPGPLGKYSRVHLNTASIPTHLTVFRDGLAVEINSPPYECRAYVYNDVRSALMRADNALPEGDKVKWSTRPWVAVSPELMATFPEDLQRLGCSPTRDAYTGGIKSIDVDPRTLMFRTSGSHLHMSFSLGVTPPSQEDQDQLIRFADLLMGVPFAWLFDDELEFKRRQLYGQAGEYRLQHYPTTWGIEYRVLSSRLYSHPYVFSFFSGVWKYILGNGDILGKLQESWNSGWEAQVRAAINTGDGLPEAFQLSLETLASLLRNEQENILEASFGEPVLPDLTARDLKAAFAQLKKLLKTLPEDYILSPTSPEGHAGWVKFLAAQCLFED